jgi:hypothetical protein
MLKTKEKIYIYNRNRIIYTKDNKSYFKYNRKYILLNNDDDLYTNAKNIVYKYIGGEHDSDPGCEPGCDVDLLKSEVVSNNNEDSEKKKEDEDNKKKCEDFYKVFSEVIINKIKNIIKNKENYVLYINDIDKKAIEEILEETSKKAIEEILEETSKKAIEEILEETSKKEKIFNIYFIYNLFKKYIVDIIWEDDQNIITQILNKIYPSDNENENENENKISNLKIYKSVKNKKNLLDKFKTFWKKKKGENCEDIKYIDNEEDEYFNKDTFTKIKIKREHETEIIIFNNNLELKEYLQSIVEYYLNEEIFKYYTFYKEIMNITEE